MTDDNSHKANIEPGSTVADIERAIEIKIALVLAFGVVLSCLVVAFGAVLFLMHHGQDQMQFHVFKGEPLYLSNLPLLFAALKDFKAIAIVQTGLIILIVTPLVRVLLTFLMFVRLKDTKFACISLLVSIILLVALLGEN
jgi:uncharacterized membrane protein